MSTSDFPETQSIFQKSQDGLSDVKSTCQIRQIYDKQKLARSGYSINRNWKQPLL